MTKKQYYNTVQEKFEVAYDEYYESEYEDTTEVFRLAKKLRKISDFINNNEEL